MNLRSAISVIYVNAAGNSDLSIYLILYPQRLKYPITCQRLITDTFKIELQETCNVEILWRLIEKKIYIVEIAHACIAQTLAHYIFRTTLAELFKTRVYVANSNQRLYFLEMDDAESSVSCFPCHSRGLCI